MSRFKASLANRQAVGTRALDLEGADGAAEDRPSRTEHDEPGHSDEVERLGRYHQNAPPDDDGQFGHPDEEFAEQVGGASIRHAS